MKTILITGLDGSGKSTILGELSKFQKTNSFDIIYLPHIDTDSLNNDIQLKKAAIFVNHLNHYADTNNEPGIKAIAIFGAMLLYKKIIHLKSGTERNTIFCERHPLIDTMVYAQFYAEKAGSNAQNTDSLDKLDEQFKEEIEYLIHLIPNSCATEKKASIKWLANLIFTRFFMEKKLEIKDLIELFEIGLPDKIYYLKAKAEILHQRISNREIKEAHESIQVLSKLSDGYDKLFGKIEQSNMGLVEIVDAESLSSLDSFRNKLLKEFTNLAP